MMNIVFNETCEFGCTSVQVENNGYGAEIMMSGPAGDMRINNNKGLIVFNGSSSSNI
eukprot:CAMPEP_0116878522 /NCGR_PEP_ID=MMETSP0463-20121206/10277_1 /TAXON_ID=181622 /ORGANISM="Strombidinopsis sp, Strain SopsisLIS2011" /LENGTH=56 /DNA_ID=CAMNT_0004526837 /DNA_START=290 /DNA_END=460 /DNA_ORIENTATION=+